ncbi:HpcH/HpaI aldolase/citrate lyase family protein [Motilibacter aurantiacus]|uniref:HpcH/HpaI aldolase/citrate lyase family protein n=1 Tax=Motilibacter aurantiacus TaxID=2714955 RepID=UPI001409EA58|nr:HpcH/HpaI aldolase/citrate lyase family protein [Motilibacter aurantiacus]NHC43688.1 HpcH/HpaI aldolase/citrate lyase family protein [Motilibacter aurantiacus]
MRHFDHVAPQVREHLFHVQPAPFDRTSDPATLAAALGATLYCPANRPRLAEDIVRQAGAGVRSLVVCLEDAVPDAEVEAAQTHAVQQLSALAATPEADLPLLFVRVRRPGQMAQIVRALGPHAEVLSGFVVPKFTDLSGVAYLDELAELRAATGLRLFLMPVLESPEIVYRETRTDVLVGVARLLGKHRDMVLAVRIGATDLCSAYGIRRDRELTIYDVHPVASAIGDIVNVLGRSDESGFVVTGPVWEYFSAHERVFRPLLRTTPFEENDARGLRHELVDGGMDGLLREVQLDKANGLTGKTVIHPAHVGVVHAMSVVSHEEWSDARDVLGSASRGGVSRSDYGNKMNESKPHTSWALRTMRRAEVFGVAAEDVSHVDLLAASVGT